MQHDHGKGSNRSTLRTPRYLSSRDGDRAGSDRCRAAPSAAPRAVDQIVRLVNGPFIRHEITGDQERTDCAGYYDGLEFDLAYPRSSLTTSLRPPADSILISTRIDAGALGLDERRIATGAEANKVWQFELFPYQAAVGSDDELHPLMREWLARWGEEHSADFLIGVSQREIDEALGYRFTDGLESQKNTRGAVALAPFDHTRSTPRMVIVLSDAPHFDGRRMVVGRVVSGLEHADTISARALIPARAVKNRPMVPVKIANAGIECRLPTEPTNGSRGAE